MQPWEVWSSADKDNGRSAPPSDAVSSRHFPSCARSKGPSWQTQGTGAPVASLQTPGRKKAKLLPQGTRPSRLSRHLTAAPVLTCLLPGISHWELFLRLWDLGGNGWYNRQLGAMGNSGARNKDAILHMRVSRSVVSYSLWPCGLWPARLLCPWDSPGMNTGVGCHSLLQGSFT